MCSIPFLPRAVVPVALAALGGVAAGQLKISEVFADSAGLDQGEQVVELANVSGVPVKMQALTLCAGGAVSLGNNCFELPDLVLPPKGFARVHWELDGVTTPFDIYTGLGFDLLQHPIGSLSLVDTETGAVVDYVQWGGDCTELRAAEMYGQWTPYTWVETALAGRTIAYDGDGDAAGDWFQDLTSTLGYANTLPGDPSTFVYGDACAGTFGLPLIGTAFGPPALGNLSFQITVTNGLPGSLAVFGMSPGEAVIHMYGCELLIDFAESGFMILGTQPVSDTQLARLPLPVPHAPVLIGHKVFVQAGVIDLGAPAGIAFTRGLEITL